jgi:hypothetical protein
MARTFQVTRLHRDHSLAETKVDMLVAPIWGNFQ